MSPRKNTSKLKPKEEKAAASHNASSPKSLTEAALAMTWNTKFRIPAFIIFLLAAAVASVLAFLPDAIKSKLIRGFMAEITSDVGVEVAKFDTEEMQLPDDKKADLVQLRTKLEKELR
jgi:hypothetical protein